MARLRRSRKRKEDKDQILAFGGPGASACLPTGRQYEKRALPFNEEGGRSQMGDCRCFGGRGPPRRTPPTESCYCRTRPGPVSADAVRPGGRPLGNPTRAWRYLFRGPLEVKGDGGDALRLRSGQAGATLREICQREFLRNSQKDGPPSPERSGTVRLALSAIE